MENETEPLREWSKECRKCSVEELKNLPIKVIGTNGEYTALDVDEWMSFKTNEDLISAITTKFNKDLTNFNLLGFDGAKDVVLQFESEFSNSSATGYYFVKKMGKFQLRDQIETSLFQCIDISTNRMYVAWRIRPFYLTQSPKSSHLDELLKITNIENDNLIKILDIRSDEKSLILILDVIEGTRFYNYKENITLSKIKFWCCQIIQGFMELIKYKAKMSVDVWISKDQKCLLMPFGYPLLFNYVNDPESTLESFYATQFQSIISSRHYFPILSSELDKFLTQLTDDIKTNLKTKGKHANMEDLINSRYLRSDATVHFHEFNTDTVIPVKLTVTYFISNLTKCNLRQSVGKCITEDEADIILICNKTILKWDNSNFEVKDGLDIKFLVIKENKDIIPNYPLTGSDYFKGFFNAYFLKKGGFGQIYVHQCDGSEKKVIKFFPHIMTNYQADKILPIINEVSMLNKLNGHGNIVKFIEFNRVKYDNLMFVMEFMEGGSLNDYIKLKKMFEDQDVIFYLKQILCGLAYLHINKIIHLDIKCDNILVNKDFSICKLTDFGISRRLQTEMNFSNEVINSTKIFQAPELLGTFPIKFCLKADIWSLGGAIVEMTTGKPPFSGLKYWKIIAYIGEYKKIVFTRSVVSESILILIDKCTEVDPDKRPSAQDLLNLIQDLDMGLFLFL